MRSAPWQSGIAPPFHPATDKPVLLQSLPLDSEPASETAPAFSPDGGSVVYASDSGSPGIHHIVTRTVTGLSSTVEDRGIRSR